MKNLQKTQKIDEATRQSVNDEQGVIGYSILWLMGVPASVLFLVFLLRGCN